MERLIADAWAAAGPAEIALAVSYAVIALAAAAECAELVLREGRACTRRWAVAARMGAGGLVAGAIVTSAYAAVWPILTELGPGAVQHPVGAHPVVRAVVSFIAWDAAGYLYHRLGHGTRLGWASHRVHHTGTTYDLSLALRQSWFPLHAVAVFPLVALVGVDQRTAAICAALSNLWQALLHTRRDVALPAPLDRVLITPALHRRHHLAGAGSANLGAVFTVWDRIGGTFDPEPLPSPARYGIAGVDDGTGAVDTELWGWRVLLTTARRGPRCPR